MLGGMFFDQMAALGLFAMFFILAAPTLFLGLALPYGILRIRDAFSPTPDPMLGAKTALHFFLSLGILQMLIAFTIVVVEFMVATREVEHFSRSQRIALALGTSGILFTIFHLLFLLRLPADNPNVSPRRVFLGWRLAIHGLVVLFSFTALMVLVLRSERMAEIDKENLKALVGVLIVWTPSWIVHLGMMIITPRSFRPQRDLPVAVPWEG